MNELLLRAVYIANILVAGSIGVSALLTPVRAARTVFEGAVGPSEGLRVVGALWLAIAVLSAVGLWQPKSMSPVLLLQVIYKGSWLLVVALPAWRAASPFPRTMALFFVVWVVVLPFVIPWRFLFGE